MVGLDLKRHVFCEYILLVRVAFNKTYQIRVFNCASLSLQPGYF